MQESGPTTNPNQIKSLIWIPRERNPAIKKQKAHLSDNSGKLEHPLSENGPKLIENANANEKRCRAEEVQEFMQFHSRFWRVQST
jgi:hypothetical protein